MSLIIFSCLIIQSPDSLQISILYLSTSPFLLIANTISARGPAVRLNNYSFQLAIASPHHISWPDYHNYPDINRANCSILKFNFHIIFSSAFIQNGFEIAHLIIRFS